MAVAPGKVMAGPYRVFVGVTAGATGTPPTYVSHTDGVPATGTEVGLTEGDSIVRYGQTKELIMAEQELGPVDVFVKDEMAAIELTCLEHTYNTLKQALDNVGVDSQAGADSLYFGGGTSVLAPRTQCVFFSQRQRNAPTKFVIWVFYKVVNITPAELNYGKSNKSRYKLQLAALADTTRNAGDRIGYHQFEK